MGVSSFEAKCTVFVQLSSKNEAKWESRMSVRSVGKSVRSVGKSVGAGLAAGEVAH